MKPKDDECYYKSLLYGGIFKRTLHMPAHVREAVEMHRLGRRLARRFQDPFLSLFILFLYVLKDG